MNSPFPGMDPYLEGRWSDVHVSLIAHMGEVLQPRLPSELRAIAQERLLTRHEEMHAWQTELAFSGVVRAAAYAGPLIDRFIHIIDVTNEGRLVTAIEVPNPWNLSPGPLRRIYESRLHSYLERQANLVELTLLRRNPTGAHRGSVSRAYGIRIHRGWN